MGYTSISVSVSCKHYLQFILSGLLQQFYGVEKFLLFVISLRSTDNPFPFYGVSKIELSEEGFMQLLHKEYTLSHFFYPEVNEKYYISAKYHFNGGMKIAM